jgi:hypothetical protein
MFARLDRFGSPNTELFIRHIELDLRLTHPNDAGTHHISSLETWAWMVGDL